jgi:hypothetical protein
VAKTERREGLLGFLGLPIVLKLKVTLQGWQKVIITTLNRGGWKILVFTSTVYSALY